ncbi:MAG: FecR domain-containing protein [Leptolyngbya sp. BL-A-14]
MTFNPLFNRPLRLFVTLTLLFLALNKLAEALPRPVTVRIERWLAVRQNQGQVTYQRQGISRSAKDGDRLQNVGDGVITGKLSTAALEVDTGIGFIQVAENTQVKVRSMGIASDNGRTTALEVPYGQVRLKLRRFNHRGSRLDIQTPAGVSAVRGTVFGMSVQPNGKTGLATLSGKVATTAQGRTVFVSGGFQNITIPGEKPTPAVPLRNNTELHYQIERQIKSGIRSLRLAGQVDPVNLVLLGESPQVTDRTGRFSLLLPAVSAQTLNITVITPLGRKQVHQLSIRL